MESKEDKANLSGEASMPPSDMHAEMHTMTSKSQKPMMMWAGIGVAVLVIAAGAWWYMSAHKAKPVVKQTYKIGLMTVDQAIASSSTAIKHAVSMAQKDNETNAVAVNVVIKDTSCDPDAAAKAMADFAKEGVVAVVGEVCSSATLAAAPVALQNRIPLISPASTSPKLNSAGAYTYRTIPDDDLSTQFAAKEMYNTYNVHKLAILHENDDYGNGTAAGLTTAMKALGGSIASDQSYAKDATDSTAQLTAIKNSGADGLFIVGSDLNNQILLKRQELGMTLPTFGPEYFRSVDLLEAAGTSAEGLYIFAPSNGTTDFAEKYQAQFKEAPPSYAAQAYDAVTAIMKGLQAGATDGASLKTQLDQITFDGVTGKIMFDKNGGVTGNYQVFVVKDGKPALVK